MAMNVNAHIGQRYMEMGRFEEAERHFDAAIERTPSDHESLSRKGAIAMWRGDRETARLCFERAIENHPGDYRTLYMLGACLQQSSLLAEAETPLRKCLEIAPSFIPAEIELALNLYNSGRKQEALASIDKVLATQPDHVSFRYLRATIVGETPETAPAGYVSELYDSYADAYDHQHTTILEYKTPTIMADALRQVMTDQHDRRTDLALMDLGCGTGLAAIAFEHITGFRAGVDLSFKMIEIARKKNVYDSLAVSDAVEGLAKAQRNFDVISACDMAVYIGNLEPLFAMVAAKLSPEGYFVISVERSDDYATFSLRPNGRYAHAAPYVETIGIQQGLKLRHQQLSALRLHDHAPVHGYIFIFQK